MSVSEFNPANKPSVNADELQAVISTSTTVGPLPPLVDGLATDRTNNNQSYVYQYGIKNIELSNSVYTPAGTFVTKPIQIEGNIMEVSLSSVEDHPLFNELDGMATDRLTSIEYYVTTKSNPTPNDWLPILPEEQDRVKSEKLFFNGQSAQLRFHADIHNEDNTKIYRNNILLKKGDWYFTNRGASVQITVGFDSEATYTIDYVPDYTLFNPNIVKVGAEQSERISRIDQFPNGTDYNNTVKLAKYPFVDYNLINSFDQYDPNSIDYRPIGVSLRNATIAAGNGAVQKEFVPATNSKRANFTTVNRTNYKNQKDISLNSYSIVPGSEYKILEYKQEKDKLIFTESFNRSDLYFNEATNHGNGELFVQYEYLATDFRIKIILRNNGGSQLVATPMVNSFQLKCKVMK